MKKAEKFLLLVGGAWISNTFLRWFWRLFLFSSVFTAAAPFLAAHQAAVRDISIQLASLFWEGVIIGYVYVAARSWNRARAPVRIALAILFGFFASTTPVAFPGLALGFAGGAVAAKYRALRRAKKEAAARKHLRGAVVDGAAEAERGARIEDGD